MFGMLRQKLATHSFSPFTGSQIYKKLSKILVLVSFEDLHGLLSEIDKLQDIHCLTIKPPNFGDKFLHNLLFSTVFEISHVD